MMGRVGKDRLKEFYENEARGTDHQEMMYATGKKHELWWHRKRLLYILDYIEDIFRYQRISSFLEVGCAEGLYVNYVASHYKGLDHYLGLDIARAYVEKARLEGGKSSVDYVVGDIENLPFRDDSVDLVLCSEVLEHIYRYQASARELCRVSKKSLVVSFPGSTYIYRTIKRIGFLRKFVDDQTSSVGHVSRITLEDLNESTKEKCGFEKMEIGGALPVQIYSVLPSVRVVEAVDKILCKILVGIGSQNYATIHVVRIGKK